MQWKWSTLHLALDQMIKCLLDYQKPDYLTYLLKLFDNLVCLKYRFGTSQTLLPKNQTVMGEYFMPGNITPQ